MGRARLWAVVALVVFFGSAAHSQDIDPREYYRVEDERLRFSFYTECVQVISVVFDQEFLSALRDDMQELLDSRLRAVGLLAEGPQDAPRPMLIVEAYQVGEAVSVIMNFRKALLDRLTGIERNTITWSRFLATDADADSILRAVDELTADFLADYLRVNAQAC